MPKPPKDIYDPTFVHQLFEKMSGTYEKMNLITSFGFSIRWRRQCVEELQLRPGMTVVDLMSGMGEAWPPIICRTAKNGKLVAVDFCEGMIRFAERQKEKLPGFDIEILCENALGTSLPGASADAVVSTFGLKTFSKKQVKELASETHRILKPGGRFSMVEISKPTAPLLHWPYLFYLKTCIPTLGKIFLNNPDSYRMLGVYTERFGDCSKVKSIFEQSGFEVEMRSYFWGCATALVGRRK